MLVKELIAHLQSQDPEKLAIFRTLDGDFGFHPYPPFEEDVEFEDIGFGDQGGVVDSFPITVERTCVILCSNEPGD